jgi:hypothetical protein
MWGVRPSRSLYHAQVSLQPYLFWTVHYPLDVYISVFRTEANGIVLRRLHLCDMTCDTLLMVSVQRVRLHEFFRLLTLSPALFAYLFTHRFQCAAGFPTSR